MLPQFSYTLSTAKMPISAAVPPTAAAVEDRSLIASNMEIEEEIEVEEECLSLSIEAGDGEKGKTTVISDDEKSPQCDGGIMTAETTNPINESSKQVNGSDKVPHSEEQTTQVNTTDDNDAHQKESRLDFAVSLIRPRSLSPALEIKKPRKRSDVMCKFFAKGRCNRGTSCRFRHIKDTTNVGDKQNETQKSDEGVTKGTRSNLAISAANIITWSSEIKPTSQKENLATDSSFNDMDKDNPPVNAVNSLHDQSVIHAGKTTLLSNDEKSPQCDGGIMTVETTNTVHESSKQVNAFDKVPHSEEQTLQVNTKDVNNAQLKESRLDVDVPLIKPRCLSPAMETKEGNKRPSLTWKATIISNDEKSSQCDGEFMTAETRNPINGSSKQVTASDKVSHSEKKTTQVNTMDANDAHQKESRLDFAVSLIKPRRLSPALEIKKGNKRQAVMCKFFAKGRCVYGTSCRYRHIKDTTNVGDKQNETQKSDEGVSEGTISNLAISTANIITCSSEIKPTPRKENLATDSSFDDMDEDNPPVNAVNLLLDQPVILAGKTTRLSNDEKSPRCDGGIMTAETPCSFNQSIKQGNASDKVPYSEEQSTQVNTKDVIDAQLKESRLDVDVPLIRPISLSPAMETKEGNKRPALTWKATIISNDEKYSQCDGEFMTAETTNPVNGSSKQVTASDKVDKVPHSEEQTTQVNTMDANDAQQKEYRNLSPALEIKKRKKLCKFFAKGRCNRGTSCRFRHIKDATNDGDKQNETQKSDEGVREGTRSNLAISAANVITCSSEIKPTPQKENLAADSSFNDMDKDNPHVNAVNSLHDQSVILAGKTSIVSNDDKSLQCDGGIMTAETTNPVSESSKQVIASDKVPHSEEQTTQVKTKDAPLKKSRLDVAVQLIKPRSFSPAMEVNEGNKRPADTDLVCPNKLTDAKSSSKKRKKQSKNRELLISDLALSGAGTDPWTRDEICGPHWKVNNGYNLRDTVPLGEMGSRMHVSGRAGCLMVQAMGGVSDLINCYDQKIETEKRLREENLKNAKWLKKLQSSVWSMSENVNEVLSMLAEKEAEHKNEVDDLIEKLERAYKENDRLQRENARLQMQGKMNRVSGLALEDEKCLLVEERILHERALGSVHERQPSADEAVNAKHVITAEVKEALKGNQSM